MLGSQVKLGGSVMNLPARQETWVRPVVWEDPLEKEMATPAFLPEKYHGQKSLVGYSPWCHKVGHN